MGGYEEARVYKQDYEKVFFATLRVLRKSGCSIKAADFKKGVIFATHGGFFRGQWDPTRVPLLEYMWVMFTADESFTELRMSSSPGTPVAHERVIEKRWDEILYKLDVELKSHEAFDSLSQRFPRVPRSMYSILAAVGNPIIVFLFSMVTPRSGFFFSYFLGYQSILLLGGLIVTVGFILDALRLYKPGIIMNVIGIIVLFCSINIGGILIGFFDIMAVRDIWEYSKWNKVVEFQKRNKYHKKTVPENFCPYCSEVLKGPAKYCSSCEIKYSA